MQIGGAELEFFDGILADEATFVETLCSDPDGQGLVLDEWQSTYIRDESKYIASNKSRQVGLSMIEAAKCFARTHMRPNYSKYFVSTSLDESKNKIRYV